MNDGKSTRRQFMKRGLASGAAAGLASAALPARSVARAIGANERIRVGAIGLGIRAHWCVDWIKKASATQPVEIVAGCDVWRQRRESYADRVKKAFDADVRLCENYREILDAKDVDVAHIASPDHQHCAILAEAVQAGKDAYIEKPIAMDLDELNRTYDIVKAAKAVVQHGTQGRSYPGAQPVRAFVQSGKLGKLIRVEQSRSLYLPYWNYFPRPEKESDTNWKLFLFNRPMRPFDADQHGNWMGYRDFSLGPIGGWMSHFSDFTHYVTGCGFPVSAVCHGGIFSPTSEPKRTCPDNVTAVLEYGEGFTTSYWTHFGSGANDYMTFFGSKGTLSTDYPDGQNGAINPRICGAGSEHPDKIKQEKPEPLENTLVEDHMVNFYRCVRERKQPHADMDAGYKHGVAVLLADRAMVEGRKMTFDPKTRQIRPA
jgi:predicted dehydrogenase